MGAGHPHERRARVSSLVEITLRIAVALSAVAWAQTPEALPPAAAAADPALHENSHPPETGLPLQRSFSPKEYGAEPQNWVIVQDPGGVLYFGNTDGVREFDGQRWRLIRVANNTTPRSLAVDAQGRVHVGAVGEIGFLKPDANGQMRYVSLLDRVPEKARDLADV